MKIRYVYLFPNGMLAVFDENDQQISHYQGRVTIKGLIKLLKDCDGETKFQFNCEFFDTK